MPLLPPSLSYWESESFFKDIDLLVIGSGIVGLHAALRARDWAPKARIVVAERSPFPAGASTRNAGFACFGSMTELLDDLNQHAENEVWSLVQMRWRGLQNLRQLLGDATLQYRPWGGWEMFSPQDQASYLQCLDQLDRFNQVMAGITGEEKTFLKADEHIHGQGLAATKHLILNQSEGQIHTGKMMKGLLALAKERSIEVWGGLEINQLEPTPQGVKLQVQAGWEFQAGRVLVATNGFARQLIPQLKLMPARNQVLLTAPIANLPLQGAFHYDKGYVYFRNIDGRILIGGARNLAREVETTDKFGQTELIQHRLETILEKVVLPGKSFEIAHRWSGILGVGTQKSPIIQALHPRLAVAVRLGGMGVAVGGEVGRQGAELLLGQN